MLASEDWFMISIVCYILLAVTVCIQNKVKRVRDILLICIALPVVMVIGILANDMPDIIDGKARWYSIVIFAVLFLGTTIAMAMSYYTYTAGM